MTSTIYYSLENSLMTATTFLGKLFYYSHEGATDYILVYMEYV